MFCDLVKRPPLPLPPPPRHDLIIMIGGPPKKKSFHQVRFILYITFTLLMATEGLPRLTSDTSRSTNTDGTPWTEMDVSSEACEASLITKRTPILSISVWNVFKSRTSSANKANSKGGETGEDLIWELPCDEISSKSSMRIKEDYNKENDEWFKIITILVTFSGFVIFPLQDTRSTPILWRIIGIVKRQ